MENHHVFLSREPSNEAAKLRRSGADAPCTHSVKTISSLQSCVFCIKALIGDTKTQRESGEKTMFDANKIKIEKSMKNILLTLIGCRANLVQRG